ncbi:MAG: glycosyltransferase family 2 protein [Candidatus Eisenbacteria bacterium]|jgi:glycosyltransferase involved in cell wall biosynthesis|nr:glycosyltransferase family 2 protein [Candidatus Eisenbacteria bacterium]
MTHPGRPLLSVVIPVYNERATVAVVLDRVSAQDAGMPKEIVVVDDASSDGTDGVLAAYADRPGFRVFRQPRNMGKGAALRRGFQEARGDIVLVQDADLEYDPQDYPKMLQPLLAGKADVVYGSRFAGGESHRVLLFWHSVGNRLLTLLSNMVTNLNLTDMETGYKAFRADVIKRITLAEDRFGFEPEVTAKVARLKARVYEVGVSYSGRDYSEGKKIGWKDAVRALHCIVKYGLLRR